MCQYNTHCGILLPCMKGIVSFVILSAPLVLCVTSLWFSFLELGVDTKATTAAAVLLKLTTVPVIFLTIVPTATFYIVVYDGSWHFYTSESHQLWHRDRCQCFMVNHYVTIEWLGIEWIEWIEWERQQQEVTLVFLLIVRFPPTLLNSVNVEVTSITKLGTGQGHGWNLTTKSIGRAASGVSADH